MAKAMFITILLAVATIGAVAPREIPSFLHICDASMETRQFEECVIDSIGHLQPYLKTGIPDYNIPSLEPLEIKELPFAPSNSFRVLTHNILVRNSSNFHITKLKADIENTYFHVDVMLPQIIVNGQYDIDGKIILLPITGSGPFWGNFSNCIGSCRIGVEKHVEDGINKIRINDFSIKITVGKGYVHFDNLFGGDQVIGDVINSAINSNFDHFLKEILPNLEKALSDAFMITAQNIVSQFTFEQLFPNA